MEIWSKQYYPAMLDLSCFNIYIIGGGKVAFRKVKQLLESGGEVTLISRSLDPLFEQISGRFDYCKQSYNDDVLEKATLVIAATDNYELNKKIGLQCKEKGILCNVVTEPMLSSFIVPASVRRGSLVISVSTEGKDPALAKEIRCELEERYNEKYSEYVEQKGRIRKERLQKKKNI